MGMGGIKALLELAHDLKTVIFLKEFRYGCNFITFDHIVSRNDNGGWVYFYRKVIYGVL